MSLTPQEIQLFRHNGFIKFPTRMSAERVAALKEAVSQDVREEIQPFYRQSGRFARLSDIWGRGGIFRKTIVSNQILDPLESLIGPNIEFVCNRHNHIYLREPGWTQTLHRDVAQWSRNIISVLVYLEETRFENGCTLVVPGSHMLNSFSGFTVPDEEDLGGTGVLEQAIPVPMGAGGILALDSYLIHGSAENRTKGTRMSLTLGYHSVDELAGYENPKRALVRGKRFYMGND